MTAPENCGFVAYSGFAVSEAGEKIVDCAGMPLSTARRVNSAGIALAEHSEASPYYASSLGSPTRSPEPPSPRQPPPLVRQQPELGAQRRRLATGDHRKNAT